MIIVLWFFRSMSVYFWMYVMKYLGQLCHDVHNLFENGLAKEKNIHIYTQSYFKYTQINTNTYLNIYTYETITATY